MICNSDAVWRVPYMERFDLTTIDSESFESDALPDLWAEPQEHSAFRLSADAIAAMPRDKDVVALRMRLSELFVTRLDEEYSQLEVRCDIKRDTFQKMLRSSNGRNITYLQLAKFCVGVGLSVQEAKELFMFMGHELSKRIRPDYILLCELTAGGTIDEYGEEMEEHCHINVFSKS